MLFATHCCTYLRNKNILNLKVVSIMSNEKLAQKLRELRKVNNYTQDYVAEVLGVVRQTYSHYETGKRTPDTNALYKLAGLYNISIDDLMHLTIDIDRNVSYDAPTPTQTSNDLAGFLEYFNDPALEAAIHAAPGQKPILPLR